MNRLYFILLLYTLIAHSSCKKDIDYNFFVVGHAYGDPRHESIGLHPPFVKLIPELNNDETIDLGFFTGDIIRLPDDSTQISTVKAQLQTFTMPIHVAAGNHDIGDTFEEDFNPYCYSFIYEEDLFVILTPGLDKWNITDDQLSFLKATLEQYATQTNRVFLFMHELIWWSPEQYPEVKINFKKHYKGKTNFDAVIRPMLKDLDNEVYIFAGDLGCTPVVSHYMQEVDDNITFTASGIGSGTHDHLLKVNVTSSDVRITIEGFEKGNKKLRPRAVKTETKSFTYF